MLTGLQLMQISSRSPIKLYEEGVGMMSLARFSGDADLVVKGARAVSGDPDHCRGGQLVARLVVFVPWFNHLLNQPGFAQPPEQVCDHLVGIIQVQFLFVILEGRFPPQELPKAAASGEIHIATVVIMLALPGEEDGSVFFSFVFVQRPWRDQALAALLLDILLEEL